MILLFGLYGSHSHSHLTHTHIDTYISLCFCLFLSFSLSLSFSFGIQVLTSGALQTMLFSFSFPMTPQSVTGSAPPFVSFFSGHVANTVMTANFMYLKRDKRNWGKFLHLLNLFQVVRLLATRGHYSIDIIVGWLVAVYVSNPAERLGTYFSKASEQEMRALPQWWATEKDWFSDLMYAEVNAAGGKIANGQAPLREFAKRAQRYGSIRYEDFSEKKWKQLEDFQQACIDRGLALPTWLDTTKKA